MTGTAPTTDEKLAILARGVRSLATNLSALAGGVSEILAAYKSMSARIEALEANDLRRRESDLADQDIRTGKEL